VEHTLCCECGYETRGSEATVVAAAQTHAWIAHGMELSDELARSLVRPRAEQADDKGTPKLED
jgi:predicted small metal-binding protein